MDNATNNKFPNTQSGQRPRVAKFFDTVKGALNTPPPKCSGLVCVYDWLKENRSGGKDQVQISPEASGKAEKNRSLPDLKAW